MKSGWIPILAMGALVLRPLYATEADDRKQQLEEVQARIKNVQESLDNLTHKKNSVLAKLRDNERLYGEISRNLKSLEQKTTEQERRLVEVRKQRDVKRAALSRQKDSLAVQINAAHAMGQQDRLRMLLSQEEPEAADRMLGYYDYFNRERLVRVDAFRTTLEGLASAENELLQRRKSLTDLHRKKEIEAQALVAARSERKQLLTRLDREYRDRNSKLMRLREDESQFRKLIHSIQTAISEAPYEPTEDASFRKLKGRLNWPVRGKLLQRFGARRMSGSWDGVLIKARDGDVVRAVSGGQVIYADWLRGYGLIMIIDHGDGYMTLYAFNQSLYKAVGDRISPGDPIASVGRSGGRTHAGLYFGIRRNGKPVNPQKWCKKVRNGQVG